MDDFREAVDMYKKMGFITLDKAMGSSGHFGCDIWMLKMLS
jgi:putative acetyltransferase